MNISEQIFNELNTIIEKLKDPNISALEKEELIKRKEDLTKRFSNHCKSGEVTPIKVLSSLTSEEEALEINYLIENKIVDFIMPQIYYGFDNTNLPFVNTVNSWSNLVKDTNIKFYVALALYKSGLEDKYAKTGINEWINNNDIISKQIIVSRNTYNYEGFSIFRYDYLFNSKKDNKQLLDEVFYVKKLLKNKF